MWWWMSIRYGSSYLTSPLWMVLYGSFEGAWNHLPFPYYQSYAACPLDWNVSLSENDQARNNQTDIYS